MFKSIIFTLLKILPPSLFIFILISSASADDSAADDTQSSPASQYSSPDQNNIRIDLPYYSINITLTLVFLCVLLLLIKKNTLKSRSHIRRHTDRILITDEQRFHSIFDNAPLGIAVIDNNLATITEFNSHFSRLLKQQQQTILATPFHSFIHPTDIKIILPDLIQLSSGDVSHISHNVRILRQDGHYFWVNITLSPLIINEDAETELLCMIEDISFNKARTQVLQTLAESHTEEQTMFDLIAYQLVKLTLARSANITMINQHDPHCLDTLSAYVGQNKQENYSFQMIGSPYFEVYLRGYQYYQENLESLFPYASFNLDFKPKSYLGMPLYDNHKVIGILSILHDQPMLLSDEIIGLIHSLATRANIEMELKKDREQLSILSLAMKYSPNGIMIIDTNGTIRYANPKASEITEYSEDELYGKNINMFRSDNNEPQLHDTIWNLLSSGKEWRGVTHNKTKHGELYWAREFIAPILNTESEINHFISIQEDITESKRIQDEIEYQARHDPLTGLINRAEFERRLHRVVNSSQDEEVSHILCFMDLDQFKIVNDSSGHIAGDELLRQLSAILQNHVRQRDTLARIGGDEFAILMEHCDIQPAERSAEEIRQLVEDFQFKWEDRSYRIGASIGLAKITSRSLTATEVLKHADLACYAAKEKGRNCTHTYHEEDAQLVLYEGDIQWVNRINDALENDYFQLYIQIIKSLNNGSVSYEILLRLQEESDGPIIPPGAFLPAAERYNLIRKIDSWVIRKTFEWLSQNNILFEHTHYFSINLSGQSIGDETLLTHIITQLTHFNIPPDKIVFEITETAAISNLHNASHFITQLKSHGCRFALDDFGSGLSSFSYLKNLHVDYLKIDGLFVKNIVNDPIDAAMVKSINEIGHVMEIETIAEFVESQEICERLQETGLDYVQGFNLGKPFAIDLLKPKKNN